MAEDRPNTSTAREALVLAGAAEELMAQALDPVEAATYIGTIVDSARTLRAHQATDVTEHIHYRADRIADQRRQGWVVTVEDDEPTEPDDARDARHEPGAPGSPEAEQADRERIEQARARVDSAVRSVDG